MPDFELTPFPSNKTPHITIAGTAKRTDNQLTMQYKINGEIEEIIFPASSTSPSRKDDLWKATCFEFFIAIPNQPQYWEFNMSPSGDWNVYKMDAYRQVNMREETAITQLPFEFNFSKDNPSLTILIELSPIIQSNESSTNRNRNDHPDKGWIRNILGTHTPQPTCRFPHTGKFWLILIA